MSLKIRAKELHTTTKADVLVVVKPTSGKTIHWCTPHFEELSNLTTSSSSSSTSSSTATSSTTSSQRTISQPTPSHSSPAPPSVNSSDTDSEIQHVTYPSPQPSTSFSSPPPTNKRRRSSTTTETSSSTKKNKSTQTASFNAGLEKQCNVCLSEEEKGYWVGCDHKSKKCQYWVHDRCLGFTFKNKAELKKVVFK
ncbi:uncharacterized protein LOC134268231 [Saccostrea cucullata]|uniref:uncharacterized protein LOC134268231 n=1 Tax=Saccostrea cuccullata TaxID=36930 RepID=UPI002ED3CF32